MTSKKAALETVQGTDQWAWHFEMTPEGTIRADHLATVTRICIGPSAKGADVGFPEKLKG